MPMAEALGYQQPSTKTGLCLEHGRTLPFVYDTLHFQQDVLILQKLLIKAEAQKTTQDQPIIIATMKSFNLHTKNSQQNMQFLSV